MSFNRYVALVCVVGGAQLAAAVVSGCSALAGVDSGVGDASNPDGKNPLTPDAGFAPHLVVVNGMDQALAALNDDDVRVCLGNTSADRPLPDDPSHPIPLSNYAGIPVGGGVDLGEHVTPATIYVISAKLQDQNFAGSGPSNEVACDQLLGTGAKGRPYLTVNVPAAVGADHVVVLLDGIGDAGATAATAVLDNATYGPSDAGPIAWAQVGAFGPWARQGVTVETVDLAATTDAGADADAGAPDAATSSQTIATFDGGEVSTPPSVRIDLSSYVDRSLRFTAAGSVPSSFEQTFQMIQTVSDPATSPSAFYDVRANFLFLVLGAPGAGDAGGPSFGGRDLHIVAIPYVP